MDNLPGTVTATAGFRATTCEPSAAAQILRIIRGEIDPDVAAAKDAGDAFEQAVLALVRRLGPKDFELLVDLILARSGWVRIAKIGGSREGIDVECENPAIGEIAFVQVKSTADQRVLDDYMCRFSERRDRYQRMIFAVHTEKSQFVVPPNEPVQVWNGRHIANLAVKLGLSDWVANRI